MDKSQLEQAIEGKLREFIDVVIATCRLYGCEEQTTMAVAATFAKCQKLKDGIRRKIEG